MLINPFHGSSFELPKYFDKVTGLDFSVCFIRIGTQLKESGKLNYIRTEEGRLSSYQEIKLAGYGLDKYSNRVDFFQIDICNLKSLFTVYDLVFVGDLIDRLYDPERFLQDMNYIYGLVWEGCWLLCLIILGWKNLPRRNIW